MQIGIVLDQMVFEADMGNMFVFGMGLPSPGPEHSWKSNPLFGGVCHGMPQYIAISMGYELSVEGMGYHIFKQPPLA